MKILDPFVALAIFISWPLAALIPAATFFILARLSGRRSASIASLLWAAYAAYEYGMKARILCGGECNIRVDLLLIYPALICLSVVALFVSIRALLKKSGP